MAGEIVTQWDRGEGKYKGKREDGEFYERKRDGKEKESARTYCTLKGFFLSFLSFFQCPHSHSLPGPRHIPHEVDSHFFNERKGPALVVWLTLGFLEFLSWGAFSLLFSSRVSRKRRQ